MIPRFFFHGALLVGLVGCSPFMPSQKAEILSHLSSAQDSLARARATIAVDPQAQFPKIEPHMIAALASAQQALDLAEARASDLQGGASAAPAGTIADVVRLCRDAVLENTQFMRQSGVPPNQDANLETIMNGTCSTALFAEGLATE